MTLFQGIVLATVQGLTEFLPISSTAHLVLVPWFFGWHDPGLTYDLVLHAGTLFALLAYFARTWWELLGIALRSGTHVLVSRPNQGAFIGGQRNSALLQVLVVATLPAAVAGYVLEVYAETVFRSPVVIAGMLVGVGLLMWVADRRPALTRRVETLGLRDALVIGMAQAVAIIPGTSRAGITIAAALFRNLTRESAAQFSFLLATPIIAGATISEGLEIWASGLPTGVSGWDLLVGFVVSAVAGYAAITFLLRYLQVRTLNVFIAYRLTLGGVILLLELLRSSL